jgi:heterokaryon incompatibility protein (HET)
MGLIYRKAHITIIASAGDDAVCGLPGVNGQARERQPIYSMSSAFGEVTILSTLMHPHETIARSAWATQGWSLQEAALSRRLVFTKSQLYFKCDTMNCSEALPPILDLIHDSSGNMCSFLQPGILAGRNGSVHMKEGNDRFARWRDLILEFSRRKLTYDSGAYNAFAGIIRYFSLENMGDFWGHRLRQVFVRLRHTRNIPEKSGLVAYRRKRFTAASPNFEP